jgi:hypothetical protein
MKTYFSKKILVGALVCVAIAGTIGIKIQQASAQANPTSGHLQLCVKHSGIVFAIGSGFKKVTCAKNDKLIQIGQGNGLPGAQGPQGSVGEKGPMVDKGEIGDKGPTGDKGAMGDQGIVGLMGAVGAKGPDGDKGSTGDVGPQGPAGEQGPTGPQGPAGPMGEKGEKGDKGEPGDSGSGSGGINGTMIVLGAPDTYVEPSAGTGVTTAGVQVTSVATCPDGKTMLSGGAETSTSDSSKYKVALFTSYPSSLTTWTAVATEVSNLTADRTMTVTAFAVCTI